MTSFYKKKFPLTQDLWKKKKSPIELNLFLESCPFVGQLRGTFFGKCKDVPAICRL